MPKKLTSELVRALKAESAAKIDAILAEGPAGPAGENGQTLSEETLNRMLVVAHAELSTGKEVSRHGRLFSGLRSRVNRDLCRTPKPNDLFAE